MAERVERVEGLVVEAVDGGLVLYDPRCSQAHWLDPEAAAVWRACGRSPSGDEVASIVGGDRGPVAATLVRLEELGLVRVAGSPGVSRRSVLVTAARVGAAGAVAAPIISAVIPSAAAAASTPTMGGGGTGTGNNPPPPPDVPSETSGTFHVPAGYKVYFTNGVVTPTHGYNYCPDDTLGYQLDNGATQSLGGNSGYACGTVSISNQQIGAFASDESLVIDLTTNDPQRGNYVFKSSNPNHTYIQQDSATSWTVYLTDDEALGIGPGEANKPFPDPGGYYNAKVTVTIGM